MILCRNCQSHQMEGSIFCADCGSRLVELDSKYTQVIRRGSTGRLEKPEYPRAGGGLYAPAGEISFILMESGKIIPAEGKIEIVLGRFVDGQSAQPDIDLSTHDGYGQGVSRLHAVIKNTGQQVSITDLGSSNGTRINGQKIAAQIDFPLNHGDVITMGKLKIQILIRKQTSSLQ